MFIQILRASRSSLARVARQQPASSIATKRTFIIPTAIRRADLVQELYLRELKNYKAPAVKVNDSEGQVQKFAPPAAPKTPEEVDIASELKEYEASSVEIEGQAVGGVAVKEDDWFEEEPEDEEEPHH